MPLIVSECYTLLFIYNILLGTKYKATQLNLIQGILELIIPFCCYAATIV